MNDELMKDGRFMNKLSMEPDQELLNTLVKRIIETTRPLRIILFGSAAEGRMGPDSDLDILVIVRDGMHRRRTAQAIYKSLSGLGISKDIIVVTEGDVREHGDKPSLVIFPALNSGKELYRAAA
jgi:predicted nucleotidyltransferase